jgi:hypothetical protein
MPCSRILRSFSIIGCSSMSMAPIRSTLIAWLIGTRWNHPHAIMHGHFLIRRVQVGIVAAGFRYAGFWCCRAQPVWACLDRTRKPERVRRSSSAAAHHRPQRRCMNWLQEPRRIDAPAARDHHEGRRSGWWFPPNQRTASRRRCAPGAAPHLVCGASADTVRRNGSSDSRPVGLPILLSEQLLRQVWMTLPLLVKLSEVRHRQHGRARA